MSTKRPRRPFTLEYRAEVLAFHRVSRRSILEIAQEFDLPASVVRRWVAEADTPLPSGTPGPKADERAELLALQREHRLLLEERDVLRRAVDFFAIDQR